MSRLIGEDFAQRRGDAKDAEERGRDILPRTFANQHEQKKVWITEFYLEKF